TKLDHFRNVLVGELAHIRSIRVIAWLGIVGSGCGAIALSMLSVARGAVLLVKLASVLDRDRSRLRNRCWTGLDRSVFLGVALASGRRNCDCRDRCSDNRSRNSS